LRVDESPARVARALHRAASASGLVFATVLRRSLCAGWNYEREKGKNNKRNQGGGKCATFHGEEIYHKPEVSTSA